CPRRANNPVNPAVTPTRSANSASTPTPAWDTKFAPFVVTFGRSTDRVRFTIEEPFCYWQYGPREPVFSQYRRASTRTINPSHHTRHDDSGLITADHTSGHRRAGRLSCHEHSSPLSLFHTSSCRRPVRIRAGRQPRRRGP